MDKLSNLDKIPNELIKDILKKNDVNQIMGLCHSNKYFRDQCSEMVRRELVEEYMDDLGIYLAIKNKPFYITITTSDGERRLKVIRSKDEIYKNVIELIKEVCKNYTDVRRLDISSDYDNRKNPTMLNIMCFFYAQSEGTWDNREDEYCIKMLNVVISGNFKGYEVDRLDDDIANYIENYLINSSRDLSSLNDELSGGSPDTYLQKKLLKNIQKEYGIHLPSKVVKKSKKRSKKKFRKKSPLKYEIKGGSKKSKSRAQYYGKRSKVMVNVPENVKNTAIYAFKLKKLGFGGGLETGWKRAKQLATKDSIPIQDLKYMHAWFSRHIYTSYPSYKKWKDAGRPKESFWHKKHGIISWLIWGGSPAFNWVNSKVGLLNKNYPNKNYKKIKI